MLKNKFSKHIPIIFLLFVLACARDPYDNEMLYNSVGFDPGTAPPQNQVKISQDYYYRQVPPNNQYQGGQMPYPPSQQYQMPPTPYGSNYYQPNYSNPPPYQVYPNAGSRFYSNPYAIPPSPYYPQYDADQYYVPPTYSYGMEQSNSPRASTINR